MDFKIRIHKIKASYAILFSIFVVLFFHRYIIELGVPGFLKYILDVLNILLFIIAVYKKRKLENQEKILLFFYIILIMSGTVAAFANIGVWKANFVLYLFDCRSLLRYLIFFLSCKTLLEPIGTEKIFNFILGFHLINCILIIYQYFTVKVEFYWMRGDNLNGFFGIETGGNIYVNALILAVTIIVMYKWTNGLCSKKILVFFLMLNIITAVLIELKAYFIEIFIIVLFYLWPYIKKPTRKHVLWGICIISGGIVVFYKMVNLLYKIYPWMKGTLSINTLVEISSSNGTREIGRLSAISDVINNIYNGNIISSLLGVGLGTANTNGEMAEFAQRFYDTHYSWYSLPYIFIETGLLGLLAYLLSFLYLFTSSKNMGKYSVITRCSSIISIFIIIYNETFRTEAGYFMFFLLSLAFTGKNVAKTDGG